MGSNGLAESEGLTNLAQRLRLYKSPSSIDGLMTQVNRDSIKEISQELSTNSELEPNVTAKSKSKRAAVLICLFEGEDGGFRVILTKRSSKLSTHSGDVSLPGGKTEEGDADDIETALREAKEEIGLDPSLVDVVTVLEPFVTKVRMTVVPVLGILPHKSAFTLTPNTAEVESIFDAPLDMFLKDENRRAEEREWRGNKYLLHFFDYEAENGKYVIWALTAGILIGAASIVYQRQPDFLEQRPNFWSRNC